MTEEQLQPIIIKRKKHRGHGGHHGGALKVAVADFMTAMMAFFLVMWLVGQKPDVRKAVAGYFRDPGKFSQKVEAGMLKGSSSPMKTKAASQRAAPKEREKSGGPTKAEKEKLTLAANNIMSEFEKQKVFEELKKNIKITLTSDGLRITLNESEDGAAFFEPGSDKLLKSSAILLMIIAHELGKLTNRLVIEGHTDASSSDGAYTNWELSAARANSARRLMDVSGLDNEQVNEVRGFASRMPMIMDDPSDPRNRRISIVVLYQHVASGYDQMEIGEEVALSD